MAEIENGIRNESDRDRIILKQGKSNFLQS